VTRPKADVRKSAEDMRRFQKEHSRTLRPVLSFKELIEKGRRTFRERFILQPLALITDPLAKGGED
jgi:hypothetical protein